MRGVGRESDGGRRAALAQAGADFIGDACRYAASILSNGLADADFRAGYEGFAGRSDSDGGDVLLPSGSMAINEPGA